ncbi:hypothetical protein HanPI659440_Chr04g0173711 [Helianthus annuus]|nr:hypothetical protein HanPI659440_Chr04g0173711 [Helianthus annuus]
MINEEVKPKETNMKTLMNLHSAYKTTTVVGVLTCLNCFAAIRLEGMGFVPTPVELRRRRQPILSPPPSSSVPSSASCAERWRRS